MTPLDGPALSARRFLTCCLLDRQHGGVFMATDAAGTRPRSAVKRLVDQADAVLVLADPVHPAAPADLELALAGLRNLLDHGGAPGFRETAGRDWLGGPGDGVRTVRHQLRGATALLVAAQRFDDDRTRAEAVEVLNRCLATFGAAGAPATLEGDRPTAASWDEAALLTDAAAAGAWAVAEAVGESEVDCSPLAALAERLRERAVRLESGPGRSLSCSGLAELAVALVQVGRLLGSAPPVTAAGRVVATLGVRYADREDGGFWRWPAGPRLAGSAAPATRVKWACDAARVWAAGDLLRAAGQRDDGVVELARTVVRRLADPVHEGTFAGVRSGSGAQVVQEKSTAVQSAVARLLPDEVSGPGTASERCVPCRNSLSRRSTPLRRT